MLGRFAPGTRRASGPVPVIADVRQKIIIACMDAPATLIEFISKARKARVIGAVCFVVGFVLGFDLTILAITICINGLVAFVLVEIFSRWPLLVSGNLQFVAYSVPSLTIWNTSHGGLTFIPSAGLLFLIIGSSILVQSTVVCTMRNYLFRFHRS